MIVKEHKTITMAEKCDKRSVSKYVLPCNHFSPPVGLIKKLWETSFKAVHIKSGFRASGLCPVNRRAIPAHKLAPSTAFDSTTVVEQQLTCEEDITPVKLHVAAISSTRKLLKSPTPITEE